MEMPKLTEAHKNLQRLAGKWKGQETIAPSPWDPKGGTAIGRVENKVAINGFAVVQDYEQERSGAINFRGHGVFHYDAMNNAYVMTWFDSMGMPPTDFRGNFENGVMTLMNKSQMGHSRAIFDVRKENEYRFTMEVSQDGNQWFPFMDGQYSREK